MLARVTCADCPVELRTGEVRPIDAIDVTFDFRDDSAGGDPDTDSPTLRRYHQLLWSKPLPNGVHFVLDATTPYAYLHHRSALGESYLASDSVIATFIRWVRMRSIIAQVSKMENDAFTAIAYTIGGMLVFPSNRISGKLTLNGARGLSQKISDRLDLTLECVRRYYRRQPSPLSEAIERYSDFFELFDDFDGYVRFFLLDDLVDADSGQVKFFLPFDTFAAPAGPSDLTTYLQYRRLTIDFIHARNQRIASWAAEHLCTSTTLGTLGEPS